MDQHTGMGEKSDESRSHDPRHTDSFDTVDCILPPLASWLVERASVAMGIDKQV